MLHALVREHLAAFVRLADERYARPLPRYVKRAFEQYLRCGLPEHGFLRLRCDDCGHDRVVAFSCKERGTCPSCAGRTMANTAAHLVDRVLPNVPIRQWVLSLPFELRALAARRPEVVSAIDRILFREVERMLRRSYGPRDGRAGAVTFVQRFGGSLNLHVHFHVLFLEGLFTRDGEALPVFHDVLPPMRTDLLAVLGRVRRAVLRWLERRGLAPSADPGADTSSAEPDALDALDACANVAVQAGLFDKLDGDAPLRSSAAADEPVAIGRRSAELGGFNLHAAVAVGADDDVARERLVRYCARPPFALERLTLLPDGRIAYRMKQPRRNATHRILDPIELLARIAALIPPPRHPFMRYHGVLAPSSKWRSLIVPRLDVASPASPPSAAAAAATVERATATAHASTSDARIPLIATLPARREERLPPSRPPARAPATGSPSSSRSADPGRPRYARITVAHRARVDDGELLARSPRLDWAKLLRRTFLDDVLACPRCTGRARIVTAVHDPAEARRFLDAIGAVSIAALQMSPSGAEDLDSAHTDDPYAADCEPPPESALDPPPPDD